MAIRNPGIRNMNNKRLSLLCLLLLAPGLQAVASDIYKRVNEDGVIEFSDRPMADADRVEVNPNVVATNPVQRPARPAAPPASSAAEASTAAPRSRARVADDQTYYMNQNRRDRAVRNEARERREQRSTRQKRDDEVATDPNPGRALRNAARAR